MGGQYSVLNASRRHQAGAAVGVVIPGAGIVATVGTDSADGHGPIGAPVSAWLALAQVGSFELLTVLAGRAHRVLVDLRHLGWRRDRRWHPVPPRPAGHVGGAGLYDARAMAHPRTHAPPNRPGHLCDGKKLNEEPLRIITRATMPDARLGAQNTRLCVAFTNVLTDYWAAQSGSYSRAWKVDLRESATG